MLTNLLRVMTVKSPEMTMPLTIIDQEMMAMRIASVTMIIPGTASLSP